MLAVPNNANIEFYFDTATAFAGLTLSQTFYNYTTIKYIFAHGGGAAPSIIDRMFIHASADFKAESEMVYRKRYVNVNVFTETQPLPPDGGRNDS